MAIEFKKYEISKPTCEQEATPEQISKISRRVKIINTNLLKRMKKIAKTEAEVWNNPRHIG